ncbi:MAG: ribokinase [Pirellulales bacterium]|nr:ribokinase [Pirellulales bacterium]
MTAPKIVVLGSVNIDLVMHVPRLPSPGETVLGGRFFAVHGGKGANQAVAAARAARSPVAFVAALGADRYGQEALASLELEGLLCGHVRVAPDEATGVALILVDAEAENLIAVASGANELLSTADVDRLPEAWFAPKHVFLTCLESPLTTVHHALVRARLFGLTTVLNPAPASEMLPSDVLELVDVLTPNEHEIAALAGMHVFDHPSAVAAARRLQDRGCRQVIVTRGAAGCTVVGDGAAETSRAVELPARAVQAVDTTAAGDAFNGALAVRLAEGASLVEAARWANVAASISVTRSGAQPSLAHRDEIDAACGDDSLRR